MPCRAVNFRHTGILIQRRNKNKRKDALKCEQISVGGGVKRGKCGRYSIEIPKYKLFYTFQSDKEFGLTTETLVVSKVWKLPNFV